MKLILTAILFCLVLQQGITQNSISAYHNITHDGNNIAFNYSKIKQRHIFTVGTTYLINRDTDFYNNNVYYRNAYATKWYHHWGLNVGYEYAIQPKSWVARLSLFYNSQLRYIDHKTTFYGIQWIDDIVRLGKSGIYYPPFTSWEQTIGFSLRTPIAKNLDLLLAVGGGVALQFGIYFNYEYHTSWALSPLISTGVAYQLPEKNKIR